MESFENILYNEARIDKNSADYKQGYDDAIKAFKEYLANGGQVGNGQSGSKGDSAPMPPKLQKDAQQNGGGQSGQQSRDDQTAPGKNQGVVSPEDCAGNPGTDNTPSQAGGMIDKKTGDNMAKKEGYEESGGSESGNEKEWEKEAMKAADNIQKNQKPGTNKGYTNWAGKIKSINRPTTDWKKTLRKVVGRCLSEEDKRQAYANKNLLIAQNRIGRTDKDKYDALSTIVAFIDTSGSMDDSYKQECLEEVYHVANQKKATKILIIPFDTEPRDFISVDNVKSLKRDIERGLVQLKGGGGTQLDKCWDLFKNDKRFRGQCFELVMVFTDGYLDQKKRLPRSMQYLVWVIDKNTSWELQYKDASTFRIDLGDKNAHKK